MKTLEMNVNNKKRISMDNCLPDVENPEYGRSINNTSAGATSGAYNDTASVLLSSDSGLHDEDLDDKVNDAQSPSKPLDQVEIQQDTEQNQQQAQVQPDTEPNQQQAQVQPDTEPNQQQPQEDTSNVEQATLTEEEQELHNRYNDVKEKYKSKGLSEEEVFDILREIADIVIAHEVFDTVIVQECLKKITRIYFDYKKYRVRVCAIFIEKNFPEQCLKMYKIYNAVGVFSSDSVWFPTYYILNCFWNYSDGSKKFGQAVADAGFIKLLKSNVTHQPYLDNQSSKNVKYVLKSSLSILQNIVHVDDARKYYEEHGVAQAIEPFLQSEDLFLKTLTIMMLSVLLTEEETAQMEDSELETTKLIYGGDNSVRGDGGGRGCEVRADATYTIPEHKACKNCWHSKGTIPFIVKTIGGALSSSKRRNRGFTPTELTETLGRIAVNDSNKTKIVNAGALPNLVAMLQHTSEKEQYAAGQCLWTLSFDKQVGQQIREEPGCMEALEALTSSANAEVRKVAKGALWKLNEADNRPQTSQGARDAENDGHIMISYNWDHKESIMKIKDQLQSDGYKVWVDVEQMGGSTLEAMALAVENAKLVLVCCSEKYKLSPNCRTEAEYTFQLKKPIVPLMMQRYYKPDGWLGMLCGAKMYVNFDGKYDFDYAFNILRRELKSMLSPKDDVDGGGAPVAQQSFPPESAIAPASAPNMFAAPAPAPNMYAAPAAPVQHSQDMEYLKWTKEQVMEWAESSEMTRLSDLLQNVDGKKLYQMCRMRSQAPEFFFNYLVNKQGLDLDSILDLCNNLDALK